MYPLLVQLFPNEFANFLLNFIPMFDIGNDIFGVFIFVEIMVLFEMRVLQNFKSEGFITWFVLSKIL